MQTLAAQGMDLIKLFMVTFHTVRYENMYEFSPGSETKPAWTESKYLSNLDVWYVLKPDSTSVVGFWSWKYVIFLDMLNGPNWASML